jgi:TadE-like protein
MIFSVVKSADAEWETAPFVVLLDDVSFLEGIQTEAEAQSLCDLLNQPPLKIIPIDTTRPRWLAGGRGGRHQAGAVLLEAALVFPVLLLLILGGFDLTRLANAKSNNDWIAQKIADCTKAKTCAGAQATAQNLASGFSMNPSGITATAAGNTATVGYQWMPVSPFFPSAGVQLTSMATAP